MKTKTFSKEEIDAIFPNFWLKPKAEPKFTELELALMEGGHSIEKEKTQTYSFIKSITKPTLGPVVATVKPPGKRPRN
jgi:hypothetical protein